MIQVRDPQIGERIHDVQSDFNCVIVIRGREAYRVERFMRLIDQREKPLVVCATHAHAAMVRDLCNQASTPTDPLYCVRVTANDGALGDQPLAAAEIQRHRRRHRRSGHAGSDPADVHRIPKIPVRANRPGVMRGTGASATVRRRCDNAAMSDARDDKTTGNGGGTTHFGFRDVPVGDKQTLVGEVFSSVAGNYDLMNDAMSLGIHRIWKRYFVATAQVRKGDRVLDLAGGTGDIAALLKDRVGGADAASDGCVVLGDINGAMLRVGRDRMVDKGRVAGFEYVQLNAEKLPFPDASFDLVTIAFGLRNVTDKDAALREIQRVLKVGGQARVLEFSAVKAEWFKPIYDFHSFNILPRLGKLFAGDSDSYQYLAESIRKHPPQDELKAMMVAAGFARCDYRNLSGGIVAIHTGYKV